MTSLSSRRLTAIIEALNARLAGEMDIEVGQLRDDYEAALKWARETRAKRAARPKRTSSTRA